MSDSQVRAPLSSLSCFIVNHSRLNALFGGFGLTGLEGKMMETVKEYFDNTGGFSKITKWASLNLSCSNTFAVQVTVIILLCHLYPS